MNFCARCSAPSCLFGFSCNYKNFYFSMFLAFFHAVLRTFHRQSCKSAGSILQNQCDPAFLSLFAFSINSLLRGVYFVFYPLFLAFPQFSYVSEQAVHALLKPPCELAFLNPLPKNCANPIQAEIILDFFMCSLYNQNRCSMLVPMDILYSIFPRTHISTAVRYSISIAFRGKNEEVTFRRTGGAAVWRPVVKPWPYHRPW